MTGHKGERVHRTVALATEDFRLYHRLVPFLESHGVAVLVVRPGEPVPASVKVLLGGPAGDPRSLPVRDDPEATLLGVLAALDRRRPGREGYRQVVFGVDPGHAIGLAVLADGEVLLVGESRSPREAADRIALWSAALQAREWRVHIGDGSPASGREIAEALGHQVPQAALHFVPEGATTPWRPATGSRHADAAVLIALRRPEEAARRAAARRPRGEEER